MSGQVSRAILGSCEWFQITLVDCLSSTTVSLSLSLRSHRGISVLSLTFDVILLTQHYIIYGEREPKSLVSESVEAGEGSEQAADGQASDERRPLLS